MGAQETPGAGNAAAQDLIAQQPASGGQDTSGNLTPPPSTGEEREVPTTQTPTPTQDTRPADGAPTPQGTGESLEPPSVSPPTVEPPAGGGPPPPSGGPGPSLDDAEAFLDREASDETVRAMTEQATPWYDTRLAKGAENLFEGLIPVYGAYDAVRDNWNRHGDMVEMAPPLLESPGSFILHILMGVANLSQAVAGVLRHVSYLVSLCQWAATFSAVVDGPIGPVVAGIAGLCAETINVFTLCCEFVAGCANLLTVIVAAINAICTDDETNRLRYTNIAAMGLEGFMGNVVNLVFDFIAVASVNFIPSGVTSKVARELLNSVAQSASREIALGVVNWGLNGTLGLAEDHDYTALPRDAQGRPMKTYEWPHLSRGLFREGFLFWGTDNNEENAVVLNTLDGPTAAGTAAQSTLVAPMLQQDSRATGGDRPAGGGQQIPPPDHSPTQVDALSALSGDLTQLLAERRASQADLQAHREAHGENVVAIDQTRDQVTAQQEVRADMSTRLADNQGGLQEGMSQGAAAEEQLGALQGSLADTGAGFGGLNSMRAPQAPRQQGGGLIDRAAAWATEQATNLVVGRFNSGIAQAQGPGGAAQGQSQAQAGAAGQGASMVTGFLGQITEALAVSASTQADTAAAAGTLSGQDAQLASARATSEGEIALADEGLAEEDALIAEIEALLAEVEAERARQEGANAAFIAQYGPAFDEMAQTGGSAQGQPVQDSDAQMLFEAFDVVQGLSDGAVSAAFSRAGGAPDGARDAALDLAGQLESGQEAMLGQALAAVNAAAGAIGQSGPAGWSLVDAARQALIEAEITTRAARAQVLAMLDAIAGMGGEEEAAPQGPAEVPDDEPAAATA